MNHSLRCVTRSLALTRFALIALLIGLSTGLWLWPNRPAQAEAAALLATDGARTQLVSVNAAGTNSGNNQSRLPEISADGRYVVFQSNATDLTPTPDLNNFVDVFVRDMQTGVTTLVSVNQAGTASGTGGAFNPSISADGRYIAFESTDSNLTSIPDTNQAADVFVRDMQTGVTTLVSINRAGTGSGDIGGMRPRLSANGRVVTFESFSHNLTALNVTANGLQLYARDLQTNETKLVSINSAGTNGGQGNSAATHLPALTPDGRFIAFESEAFDLVNNDFTANSEGSDVFVRDLQTNTTTLVSINSAGTESGNRASFGAGIGFADSSVRISADGRFVAFASFATNLVAGISYPFTSFPALNVFVRDLQTHTTRILTVDSAGTTAIFGRCPAMSADGRFVAYVTGTTRFGDGQVFVRDMQTGSTTLASGNSTGAAGNRGVDGPVEMSTDGRYVIFRSAATDLTLVPDTDNRVELFVRDLQAGVTNIITTDRSGSARGIEFDTDDNYVLSDNGRGVAFSNFADLTSPADTNGLQDIYFFDNSATVSVFVSDVSLPEGDITRGDAAFTVSLSNASPQPVTVNYATADASAVAPDDYASASGTLTFNPGETSKTVHVSTSGDFQNEPNEIFFVNLTQPSGATLGRTQGVGTIVNDDAPPALQFSAANFSVSEAANRATITVERVANLNGQVTVSYQTIDDPAAVRCDDTTNNHGAAYARCDYATTIDTLTFASGETQKTFTVPIVNDAHIEGNETVGLRLFNPVGGELGSQTTATLTIVDNDAPGTPNPIFNNAFFVRQHYLDFLSREPDTPGFNAWLNVLNNCPDVNNLDPNAPSAQCDRILVSASFFGSQEFQLKAVYVFRFYRVAFNRLPQYSEIVADMRAVTGRTSGEVFQKKAQFASLFVQRPEFVNVYGTLTNSAYVAALLNPYQLNAITTPDPQQPDGTTKVTLTSSELTARLNAQTLTRAQVLRAVADSDQVSQLEFNRAFVAMQYYGYLRRTPEPAGFNAWLNYLNANPTDFRTMVNGFVNSQEYKLRFGAIQ
ncbi:MAG TPA: Calx-beta domain-containing protein [Pyrinomonadaceae bacterium]|jgi:Tol biopolymer transport system component